MNTMAGHGPKGPIKYALPLLKAWARLLLIWREHASLSARGNHLPHGCRSSDWDEGNVPVAACRPDHAAAEGRWGKCR